MSKRKLTRRQAWRVAKIQEERLQRAERKEGVPLPDVNIAALGPEQTGLVVASYGPVIEVEDAAGVGHRCALRQNLGLPVVGDRVVWQPGPDGEGVAIAIAPRLSLLARPDHAGELKPLAANLDQILVVAAPAPRYETLLIDQYLVAAELTGIHPVLVLNKIDLLDATTRAQVEEELATYRSLYPVLHASTVVQHGLDELAEALRGKTSVFVGQSGVGKSSLVGALLPGTDIRVGALSAGQGKHTTSAARLYHLEGGGHVIDSPGVREFRLWDMGQHEIARGFPELSPLLGRCRFRDCRHGGEPGCAVAEAIAEGLVSARRVESYRTLVAQMEQRARSY